MNSDLPAIDLETAVHTIRSGRAVVLTTFVPDRDLPTSALSHQEKVRAAAFRHEPSRRIFLTGRWLLREILAAFTPEPVLEIGPYGKPHCPDPQAPAFNLSHTGAALVAVFHQHGPVGVDVEPENRTPAEPERVAEKVFSPLERDRMKKGADSFLELWTRKEAVLKMTGEGFTAGAGGLDAMSLAEEKGWKLMPISFAGHIGCVCLPGDEEMVQGVFPVSGNRV